MTDPSPPSDLDAAWKETLDLYFEPFLAFLFPDAHAAINWDRSVEFLDKEFQDLIPEAEIGRRYADKLVKAWLNNGEEAFILIHVEVQSQEDSGFAQRMFIYHYRIFDYYQKRVMSLAVLGDENRNWRPDRYTYTLAGCELSLRFPIVKLVDFENRWSELEASDNPMAVVVIAHLRSRTTKSDAQARKRWKWILTRQLYEGGYSREDVIRLVRVMDRILTLPAVLKRQFREELEQYEAEAKMPLISSMEEMAKEEGREEGIQIGEQRGIQIGKQEGIQEVAINMLRQGISTDEVARFTQLSLDQIDQLRSQL
jgi:predicted transposase/invertase (TIGR01784 family)